MMVIEYVSFLVDVLRSRLLRGKRVFGSILITAELLILRTYEGGFVIYTFFKLCVFFLLDHILKIDTFDVSE